MSAKYDATLGSLLAQQDPKIREILHRGQTLSRLNHAVQQLWSHEPWIKLIRIANIRGTTLVVFVQTAAVQFPLRNQKKTLLDFLKQQFEISCTELDIKVVPNH